MPSKDPLSPKQRSAYNAEVKKQKAADEAKAAANLKRGEKLGLDGFVNPPGARRNAKKIESVRKQKKSPRY